jgi:hypothetical protein
MWKALLLVAAALGFLWWVGSIAQASEEVESPSVVVNFPINCEDKTGFLRKMGWAQFSPMWHGVRNATFLTTLWLKPGGAWVLTESRAQSKTVCVLASGEDNELLGIGGI